MLKTFAVLGASIATLAITSSADAQSNIQSSNTNSLQPQQNQTQQTGNVQTDTAVPQDIQNNINLFSQNQGAPLSVVSDPKQTKPVATVAASDSLKTDLTKEAEGVSWPIIILGLVIIWGLFWFIMSRGRRKPNTTSAVSPVVVPAMETPAVTKPVKAKKKKRKSTPGRR
jgi:hypothetical protein